MNFKRCSSRSTIETIRTTFANSEDPVQERHMNPFIIDESRERYQDRLAQAQQAQQAQQALAHHLGCIERLRVRFGDYLIALGQSIKTAAQPEPQFDEPPPAGI
jgi:hypothetical protein